VVTALEYWSQERIKKERNWSQKTVNEFLGEPDMRAQNRYCQSGRRPVKLFERERVLRAERTVRFAEMLARRDARSRAWHRRRKSSFTTVPPVRLEATGVAEERGLPAATSLQMDPCAHQVGTGSAAGLGIPVYD